MVAISIFAQKGGDKQIESNLSENIPETYVVNYWFFKMNREKMNIVCSKEFDFVYN